MTISELELSVQAGLEALRNLELNPQASPAREILLPEGLSPVVELVHENGRRKRGDAASWNWNPQSDRIVISFRSNHSAAKLASTPPSATTQDQEDVREPINPQEIAECCQALAAAEKSNRQFIALKWFRDDFLATVDYSWAKSPQRRQRILSETIAIGRIDARKIPNPRAPQFPTTTIALNRSIPTPGVPPRFQPVTVHGEAVSTTLLRDRGSV